MSHSGAGVDSPSGPQAHGSVIRLKRCLLGFWALWLTIVCVTNLLDAGKAMGMLSPSWAFASGNWHFLVETTTRYRAPMWLNAALFFGAICWEGSAAALFWGACSLYRRPTSRRLVVAAFTISLMLWAAFVVADEVLIAYPVEATHLRLFTAQLASLLVVELLPNGNVVR